MSMPKKISLCLAAVSFVSILGSAALLFADSVYWTGAGTTNKWSEAANWNTGTVPQPADSVIFDGTSGKESHIDAGFGGTIASITINGYAGNIYQDRSLAITGDYSQSSGGFVSPPNLPFSVGNSFSVSVPPVPGWFNRLSGVGTVDNPLLVYDVYGLQCMGSGSALYYKLNNNIDASVTVNWRRGIPGREGFSPVGGTTGDGMFYHSFDGDGHTISNLYINITDLSQNNVGLFGYTYGVIKNLGMINCSITGPSYIVGTDNYTGSIAGYNRGTITNCYNTGSVSSGSYTGGLAGQNGGAISYCYNIGNISSSTDNGSAGGLAGQNGGAISYCYNIGSISGNYQNSGAGGLVLLNFGTIFNSYNSGSVSGWVTAGGLVLLDYGVISNCYNTGTITQLETDGNVGCIGGLAAAVFGGTIRNSYNAGKVFGDYQVGGVIGYFSSGEIYNSYNVGVVSPFQRPNSPVSGFVGASEKYSKISNCGVWMGATQPPHSYSDVTYNEADRNAFTNPNHEIYTKTTGTKFNPWGFSAIWDIEANVGFPFLRWQVPSNAWTLNMTEMDWYENTAPYSSTGAAACQMILGYIRGGIDPAPATLTQDQIYEYAKAPAGSGELTPGEVDKALGHFDPYDSLISNWYNVYDSRPDGNPYKGYNYTVDTYDPRSDTEAINKYMRDICHWMAYMVTKEEWWNGGELVARPNTPAAIPIYGTYASWVAVKGCVTSENPCPEPTQPWNTPDFTVYGFWMKDPRVSGIGENTYKIAAECQSTYFLPLATGDAYNGLFLQVAEPPAEMSQAIVEIPQPTADPANLDFIGVEAVSKDSGGGQLMAMSSLSVSTASTDTSKPLVKKRSWRDLVDPYLLTDFEAVSAFENTKMGKPVFVERTDGGADYYLAPFCKRVKGRSLVSAVMILDASEGYFREASWTDKPAGELLKVSERSARRLVRNIIKKDLLKELKAIPKKPVKNCLAREKEVSLKYSRILRGLRDADIVLAWEPNGHSPSPYRPYWKIGFDGRVWFVTQEMKVIS